MKYYIIKNAKLRLQCLCELCALCGETVRVNLQSASNIIVENTGFWYCARNGKGTGCVQVLTNCPPCPLFLEQGLELMRESGEPMECGIFDFNKVYTQLTPSPLTIIPHKGWKWQRNMVPTSC
jgi:hypothetical protein